jgi:transposase
MDVKKASSSKRAGSADEALKYIKLLYRLEKVARQKKMSKSELYELRQRQAQPILKKFKIWLDKRSKTVVPRSLLGKALSYCLGQWHRLQNYTKSGNAGIDNNTAENAIRPFVVGRKNWLFSGTPEGAEASATLYSLIETAKANQLEPYSYLRYLFEKLPTTLPDELRDLLPQNLSPEKLILPHLASGV